MNKHSKKIITVPDERLHQRCEPVEMQDYSNTELHRLIWELKNIMRAENALGLAAPQIGEMKQVFVLNYQILKIPYYQLAFINPVLEKFSGRWVGAKEGCLSIPEAHPFVFRPFICSMSTWRIGQWIDEPGAPLNNKAHRRTHRLYGLAARVAQHEYDHLNGILCTDYAQEGPTSFDLGALPWLAAKG
jgi:peptide deformylase